MTRRSLGLLLLGVGGVIVACVPAVSRLLAQEAPNRREFTIVAKDFHYAPTRVEVMQDDLVKLTVRSEDIAHIEEASVNPLEQRTLMSPMLVGSDHPYDSSLSGHRKRVARGCRARPT